MLTSAGMTQLPVPGVWLLQLGSGSQSPALGLRASVTRVSAGSHGLSPRVPGAHGPGSGVSLQQLASLDGSLLGSLSFLGGADVGSLVDRQVAVGRGLGRVSLLGRDHFNQVGTQFSPAAAPSRLQDFAAATPDNPNPLSLAAPCAKPLAFGIAVMWGFAGIMSD